MPVELTTNVYTDVNGETRSSMIVRDATERRRIERAEREQRARLERAENASLVMAAHASLTGRWSRVPARLCDLLCYSEAELLARTIAEITHPDDLAEDVRRTACLLDGTIASFEMEKRYLHKDGTPVWVHITVSLVEDEDEAPHEFLVYVRDVTAERDAAEQVLRRYTRPLEGHAQLAQRLSLAEDHDDIYRELLHLARATTPADSLLVSRFDAGSGLRTCVFAGEIVAGAFEAYDVSGLPPMPPARPCPGTAVRDRKPVVTDDLMLEKLDHVDFGNDDDQPARASVAVPLVVLGEALGVFELQSVRPAVFTDEHVAQLMMAANRAAIVLKNLDLYERQRSACRRAEGDKARLEAVLQQAPILVATVEGPDHAFTMVNDEYAALFAHRELVGRRIVDVMPELQAQGILDLLDRVYGTGASFVDRELPMDLDPRGTGELERHYFDLVYQPLRDEEGAITGILGQIVDITDQVEARLRAETLTAELQAAYDGTIEGWARALDLKNEETAGHSQRVTELTLALSRRMGMSVDELVHVRHGALLHDIGKMGVPDRILLKPGKLDADEWETMKRHARYAYDFLHPIEHLRPALDIPLAARIFAIVDVFDALTNDRPYRKAWSCAKARAHIVEGRGTHFDPAVVDGLLELDDGWCGEVSRKAFPARPYREDSPVAS